MKAGGIVPSVNQIELHPWFPNWEILQFCHQHGIAVTSYGSMGGSSYATQIVSQEQLRQIGAQYGKTSGQVLLRWAIQHNVSVIPGTSNPEHMRENLGVFDFALTHHEFNMLNAVSDQEKFQFFGHN